LEYGLPAAHVPWGVANKPKEEQPKEEE